jgi:hypothetical protein
MRLMSSAQAEKIGPDSTPERTNETMILKSTKGEYHWNNECEEGIEELAVRPTNQVVTQAL